MPKNIVICSDGTGNSTVAGRGTNVFKLFEAVDLNGHHWDPMLQPQVAFYDDGVGTENLKPLRIIGGVAGWGLSANVRQLYNELVRVYDPGDQIYMFGFSRGAFTVRSLVGLIGTCGVLDRRKAATADQFDALVGKAYSAYRACYRTALRRLLSGDADRDEGAAFRRAYAREDRTPVRFLGVWDTVDAVGLPFHVSDAINSTLYRFKFPDPFLSDCVRQACHALSIDDERHSFHPLVWNERDNDNRIEQVWFAGVHSNVGGGYPKQGLSLVALDWMMSKAEQAGLRFNCRDRELYRDHSSVDDKLYDSRAGLGTFYRWKPRDIGDICERNQMPVRLHVSVLERIAHGVEHYAPVNLPPRVTVVTTPPDRHQDPALVTRRAANVEEVCNRVTEGGSLLASLGGATLAGRVSYYLFLVSCTAALAGVIVSKAEAPTLSGIGRSAVLLLGGAVGSPIDTLATAANALWSSTPLFVAVLGGLVLSSLLSRAADRRIRHVATSFWYQHQPELRQALKDARVTAMANAGDTNAPLCWASAMAVAVGASAPPHRQATPPAPDNRSATVL